MVEGCNLPSGTPINFETDAVNWVTILPQVKLKADEKHLFETAILESHEPVTHVRLSIFPDGGISRMRLLGKPVFPG
jgi:allantoicase